MTNRRNTFLLKRSNIPGKIPLPNDLQLGELALNTADAILYTSGTTQNQILNNYLTEESLEEFRYANYNIQTSHKYTQNDTHPTPLCHWDYTEKVISPKLGLELTPSRKASIINEDKELRSHGITIR